MAAAPLDRVVVVLGARAGEVQRGVPLHGAEAVTCDAWAEGMAASLRAGVDALSQAEAVVIALGDQPRLAPEAVARGGAARGGAPAGGAPHPRGARPPGALGGPPFWGPGALGRGRGAGPGP